ncbi:MAG: TetR/AcrR family transcriptional regulator, partial [Gemmobacter sp.]|nr:TetR/AcrR family transcriptional regulator [Gemmobacter sp.]
VEDIIASLSETLDQGIAEGSIAPVQDSKALAQSIYHQWLGASLVAGLSHDDRPLKAAMAATEHAVRAA